MLKPAQERKSETFQIARLVSMSIWSETHGVFVMSDSFVNVHHTSRAQKSPFEILPNFTEAITFLAVALPQARYQLLLYMRRRACSSPQSDYILNTSLRTYFFVIAPHPEVCKCRLMIWKGWCRCLQEQELWRILPDEKIESGILFIKFIRTYVLLSLRSDRSCR